jgi:multidrug efflux system outer membrane protein
MEATEMSRFAIRCGLACTLTASMTLSGCLMGPNYARPEMMPPAEYRFAGQVQAESLADAPWFQVFADPDLQALIRDAIANNLDLRIAVARVEEARARAGIAKSFLYPTVDVAGGYNFRQISSDGDDDQDVDTTNNSSNLGFQLSWELDLFGRIRRQREAAEALFLASEQGRRGVMVTLVGDVATNYFLLRELDLQLEIARSTLAINDRTVTYFQDRLEGGVSNRLEVDRIRANRSETAASIPEIERQIAITENQIGVLLGRPPGPVKRTPMSVTEPAPPAIPPGLPVALLERRPDVREAEHVLIAANADIGAAKALFFPTINLTGFAGVVSGDLTSFLGSSGGLWSIGINGFQPLYNAGRLKNNAAVAQARFDAAVAAYRRAAVNAYREVANALVGIQKYAEQRVERQNGVTVLIDAADLSRARYDAGLANYIEILTADERLFDQQLLVARAQGNELRSRAELYRALGGGWQPAP